MLELNCIYDDFYRLAAAENPIPRECVVVPTEFWGDLVIEEGIEFSLKGKWWRVNGFVDDQVWCVLAETEEGVLLNYELVAHQVGLNELYTHSMGVIRD